MSFHHHASGTRCIWRHLAGCAAVACWLGTAVAASVDLTPVSSADGIHNEVTVAGRTAWQNTGTSRYLYCRRPDSFGFAAGQTLYVRVTYFDDAEGRVELQYDAQAGAYTASALHTRTSRVGSGAYVSGYFELSKVLFNKRVNGSDFRVVSGATDGAKVPVRRITLSDTPFDDPDFQLAVSRAWQTRFTGPAKDYVDASTLKGKVMAGYQGWFGTPNDIADTGSWKHWVGNNTMTPENFTIDMWPDLTAYDPSTLIRAGNIMTRGGEPAYLFSSRSLAAVRQHFRWMRKHNIDGAWLQRFHPKAGTESEWVLRHVTQAAAEEGRIWAVEYDVSGMADATVAAKLQADWEWLTTQFDLLNDPRYAREGGKPVVFIWGFPFADRNFTSASANTAVDYFKAQGAYVIGGIPNVWKSLDADWQTHIEKYDGLLVWQNKSTSDAALIRGRGQDFYPHIWPGFSWANLKQLPASPPTQYTDRAGGEFYWDKGRDWINDGGADRLFIGMFDEYDEATAVMPMTDDPPDPSAAYGRFIDNQGKPGDWWMMLGDELKRMMWGQRANTGTLPTVASLANRSNIGAEASTDLATTDISSSLTRASVSGDGNTVVETVGGRECRGNASPTATHRYMYFNVNDGFAFRLANGDVTVEVEYYDSFYGSGAGTVLGLQYDGAANSYTTHPQSITTTGSDTWRTVRFEIADAYFAGRQNGSADFRLTTSGRKLSVNRVWVRLPEDKAHPFTWTNATAGPALAWSQNANWLGGIVGQSDPTSIVRLLPDQTLSGGTVLIDNDLTDQQFGTLRLGGTAAAAADTTVTLGGSPISLGGIAPTIALEAMNGGFDLTYDLAAPVILLGTTEVGGDGDATFRISGTIGGTAGIIKTGTSSLTLSGHHTHGGDTTVTAGTLALSGSLAGALTVNGGTLAPNGLPATAGAFTLDATGTFRTRINGPGAGTQYDQLTAGGSVTLGGPLDLVASPGLGAGGSFIIVNKTGTGAISGTFAGKPEGGAFTEDGYNWIISYVGGDGNDAVLMLPTPLQAWRFGSFATIDNSGTAADTSDANGDGELNLLEYATAQDPNAASLANLTAVRTANGLEITYTRSKAALAAGVIFALEWSNTLARDSWTAGASESIPGDNGTIQSVKATIPAAPDAAMRFVRLRVTLP